MEEEYHPIKSYQIYKPSTRDTTTKCHSRRNLSKVVNVRKSFPLTSALANALQ